MIALGLARPWSRPAPPCLRPSPRAFLAGHQVDSLRRHHLGLPHYSVHCRRSVCGPVRPWARPISRGTRRCARTHKELRALCKGKPSRRQRPQPTVHRPALTSAHKTPRPRTRPTTRSRARPRLHSPRCNQLPRHRHETTLKAHDGRPRTHHQRPLSAGPTVVAIDPPLPSH